VQVPERLGRDLAGVALDRKVGVGIAVVLSQAIDHMIGPALDQLAARGARKPTE
jgi:hypothetical protein